MEKIRNLLRRDTHLTILVILTIAMMIFMQITLGAKMYNHRNLASMGFQVSEFAVLALGMSLVMLLGGIDLSIISNANLTGILAGFVMTGKFFDTSGMNPWLVVFMAVIVALVCSGIFGYINGVLVSRASVPPIIATLGTMTFYGGVGMAITSGKGVVDFPQEFLAFGSGSFLGIPYVLWVCVIVAVVYIFIMGRTTFGKKIYLMGENHTAARFSAINNERLVRVAYTVVGILAGVASLMIISRVNSAKVGYGSTYLLQAMLVVVLGGISPSGGKGKIIGVILAIVNIQMMQSAFTLWQITPYAKNMIWGVMLLSVMAFNKITERRSMSSQKKKLATA